MQGLLETIQKKNKLFNSDVTREPFLFICLITHRYDLFCEYLH